MAGITAGALGGGLIGGQVGMISGLAASVIIPSLMPDAVGTPYQLPGVGLNPVSRHSRDQVVDGMEQQMRADQTTLENALGRKCPC